MADQLTTGVLTSDGVRLGLTAVDRQDAVRQAGDVLVELGAVESAYVPAMLEREASISTFIGEGVAIPHGTDASRSLVHRTTLAVLSFPDGVDWDGAVVRTCVAIAARGEEHVAVLAGLAEVLMDPDRAEQLRSATEHDQVLALLAGIGDAQENA